MQVRGVSARGKSKGDFGNFAIQEAVVQLANDDDEVAVVSGGRQRACLVLAGRASMVSDRTIRKQSMLATGMSVLVLCNLPPSSMVRVTFVMLLCMACVGTTMISYRRLKIFFPPDHRCCRHKVAQITARTCLLWTTEP